MYFPGSDHGCSGGRPIDGMIRTLLLVLLVALPAVLRAHTTEFLGGGLAMRPDGVVELRLEILAHRLPVFGGELPGAYRTVADLRAAEPVLSHCFESSLVVFLGGKEIAPTAVEWPILTGVVGTEALPEFVPVAILWRGLPFVPASVIPRFDLPETYVMLVLDQDVRHQTRASEDDGEIATAPVPVPTSWWSTLRQALIVGYAHIVPHGLDHILFVLGLFFAARRGRDLVWQVTMFTVAHSLTLGLAMAGVVAPGDTWATMIEIGIAVSIVAVAVENCVVRESPGGRRLAIVGIFGLIHGLGFAGALSAVNWPADRFLPALVAANVGIELGQLTIVGVAAVLVAWMWRCEWYRGRITIPASVAIGLCGLFWAVQRTASLLAT